MTRGEWHEKLLASDSGDDHGTVLFIFSSHHTNTLHEKGNTVALNYMLARTLLPIPCFRQCGLDVLLFGPDTDTLHRCPRNSLLRRAIRSCDFPVNHRLCAPSQSAPGGPSLCSPLPLCEPQNPSLSFLGATLLPSIFSTTRMNENENENETDSLVLHVF